MSRQVARRWVDLQHQIAATSPDPVAFMRGVQADAEDRYVRTGGRQALDDLGALSESLDGAEA